MSTLRTVVCIKQILDPEVSPREFSIDPDAKDAARGRIPLVIGPFDLNAVELALQLKEKAGGTVTVVTVGTPEAKEALRRALAMGCDDAILVHDPAFEKPDSGQTARILAAAIRKKGGADLVLCGRQSGDWDFGQVGPRLAEELDLPCVAVVPHAEPVASSPDTIRLRQEARGGNVIVEASLPLVATVTNADTNQPRMAKVRDIMMANRKPLVEWSAADLGVDAATLGDAGRMIEVLDLFIPVTDGECEMVEGETDEEKGIALARRLRELKVI